MSDLSTWFHKLWNGIVGFWHDVEPQLVADVEQVLEALAPIAFGIVTEQVPAVLSGGEKLAMAIQLIGKQLGPLAEQVTEPVLHLAVQQAVVAAKLKLGGVLAIPEGSTGTVSNPIVGNAALPAPAAPAQADTTAPQS